MQNSLSTVNATSFNALWNTHPQATFTTWSNEAARNLRAAANSNQQLNLEAIETDARRFYGELVERSETYIDELQRQQDNKALCRGIITTAIQKMRNVFLPAPSSRQKVQDSDKVQDIDDIEYSMAMFHTWCEEPDTPALLGSLKDEARASTHAMIQYAEQDRKTCLETYHQRLQTHRNASDITFLSEKRNDSSQLLTDLAAFEKNTLTHHSADQSEAAQDNPQPPVEVIDESNRAVAKDETLQAAEQCVSENDRHIQNLQEIRQALQEEESPFTRFALWLNNLMRRR